MSNNISNGVSGVGTVNGAPTASVTLSGTLTDGANGQLALTQSGAGTLVLTNAGDTYTGATTVTAGTLQIGSTASAGAISTSSGVTVSTGGTLSLVNVNGGTFSNNVSNGTSGSGSLNIGTLKINSANSTTVAGTLTDGTHGQLALSQSGAGTTILTNTGNNYTGATTVSNGVLQIGTAGQLPPRSAVARSGSMAPALFPGQPHG